MKKHIIEVSRYSYQSAPFVDWLNDHGHDASLGNTTGNYIDGVSTSHDWSANDIMTVLWESYCDQ